MSVSPTSGPRGTVFTFTLSGLTLDEVSGQSFFLELAPQSDPDAVFLRISEFTPSGTLNDASITFELDTDRPIANFNGSLVAKALSGRVLDDPTQIACANNPISFVIGEPTIEPTDCNITASPSTFSSDTNSSVTASNLDAGAEYDFVLIHTGTNTTYRVYRGTSSSTGVATVSVSGYHYPLPENGTVIPEENPLGNYSILIEKVSDRSQRCLQENVFTLTASSGTGSTFFPSILELVEDPLQGRFTSLGQIASLLVPMILIIGGMLAALLLIWGGIKYISARGDPKAVDSARGTITSAIIGLAILASIFVIAAILQLVFKIRVLTSIAAPVYAQGVDIGCEFKFAGRCVNDVFPTLGSLFTSVINFALAAGGLLFFFIIIWGGIRYMLSRGDEKQLMDARQTLSNGVIGILIIVSAFAIIKLIELATGANISIL